MSHRRASATVASFGLAFLGEGGNGAFVELGRPPASRPRGLRRCIVPRHPVGHGLNVGRCIARPRPESRRRRADRSVRAFGARRRTPARATSADSGAAVLGARRCRRQARRRPWPARSWSVKPKSENWAPRLRAVLSRTARSPRSTRTSVTDWSRYRLSEMASRCSWLLVRARPASVALSSRTQCRSMRLRNGNGVVVRQHPAERRRRARDHRQAPGQRRPCRGLDAGDQAREDVVEHRDLIVRIVRRAQYEQIGELSQDRGLALRAAGGQRVVEFRQQRGMRRSSAFRAGPGGGAHGLDLGSCSVTAGGCRAARRRMSARPPATGRLSKNPCAVEQPAARNNSICSRVSTPSAVVAILRVRARLMTAQTIAAQSDRSENSPTNERSILILSNGNISQIAQRRIAGAEIVKHDRRRRGSSRPRAWRCSRRCCASAPTR